MGCEMTTGEKILELRNKKRISQDRLAELLGGTRQAVSKWELDETLPDIENAINIFYFFLEKFIKYNNLFYIIAESYPVCNEELTTLSIFKRNHTNRNEIIRNQTVSA